MYQGWSSARASGRRVRDDFSRVPLDPGRPSYYGLFEGNDPAGRLLAIANFDNDVPEYWEWSGDGLFPVDSSSEAYKLGVNYLIYGLTR